MIGARQVVMCGVAILIAAPVRAERLPPKDECAADAGFVAFRGKLAAAVARRDAAALLALTADDVTTGLNDAEAGRAKFRAFWKLARPAGSPVWRELRLLLAQGCSLKAGDAGMPFYVANFPEGRDFWGTAVPVRAGVALRARPLARAAVVATLDYDLLTVERNDGTGWYKVTTDDGRAGYVAAADARMGMSYVARFARAGGRWRLTSLSVPT